MQAAAVVEEETVASLAIKQTTGSGVMASIEEVVGGTSCVSVSSPESPQASHVVAEFECDQHNG